MKEAKEIARSLQQKSDQFGYVCICIKQEDMEKIGIALNEGFQYVCNDNNQGLVDLMDAGLQGFRGISKGVKLGWNSVAALRQDSEPKDRAHLLKPYHVVISEGGSEFDFECQAENNSHAKEQAENAYPSGKVISTRYLEHLHRYVECKGLCCPCCGSNDISGNEWNADAGYATQEVGCDNCGATWDDDYTLTGVTVHDAGDGAQCDSVGLTADDKFVCVNCGETHDIEDSVQSEGGLVCPHCEVDVISNIEDWQQEVRNSDTKLGFAEWMLHRREEDSEPRVGDLVPTSCPYGCGNTDAEVQGYKDGVTTLRCTDCGKIFTETTGDSNPVETKKPFSETGILAEVHSEDRVFEVEFDATAWFRQASDDEILSLSEVKWGGDYAADQVAEFHSANPEIAELFNYLDLIRGGQDENGSECHVNAESAMTWLKKHRNGLCARVLCQGNDVSLVEAQEDEIKGRWDWLDSHGNASDCSLETIDEAALDAVGRLGLA